jgi:hypothetical protein
LRQFRRKRHLKAVPTATKTGTVRSSSVRASFAQLSLRLQELSTFSTSEATERLSSAAAFAVAALTWCDQGARQDHHGRRSGPAREKLVHEREAADNTLTDFRIEKAKVDGERKAVDTTPRTAAVARAIVILTSLFCPFENQPRHLRVRHART